MSKAGTKITRTATASTALAGHTAATRPAALRKLRHKIATTKNAANRATSLNNTLLRLEIEGDLRRHKLRLVISR
jgi:hypothetical protein